jgi:hypothetical protein
MKTWLIQHKRIVVVSLSIVCAFLVIWQLLSVKIGESLQNTLIQRVSQQVNGRLLVGAVDLSLSGRVRIRNVSLYDEQGSLLAQIPVIKMHYHWSDLTGGSLGLPKIETVILEQPELWLKQDNNSFNWDGLLKEESDETAKFRGNVEIEDGKIHIDTTLFSQLLENATGTIDWKNAANMAINIKGKVDQNAVDVSGQWGGGNRPGELKIQTSGLDMTKFNDLFTGTDYSVQAGTLQSLLITVEQDDHGTLKYQAEGEFSGLKVSGKLEVREGQGKFSADGTGVTFGDLQLLISDQLAQGQGNISWPSGKVALDFALTFPDADPAVFMTGITAARPLGLQVRIAGTVSEPLISGSFSLPQISFSDMQVANVAGNFRYVGNQVLLQQVQGLAYQGTVAAAGTVVTEGQSYELDVSGQGMDSSHLTDKDVQGPLSFSGHVSGKGETAVTRGKFTIHDGKAYGISFQEMTGSFVKKGTTTDISDLAIQTAYGTIYPEQLSREALERLKQQDLPVTQGELKRVVTNKLIERLFH